MGWMQALCKTYDNLAGAFNDAENPLIPVGFTQMQPAYYVALTQEGEVDRIAQWPEKERILVPSTEGAEGRTGAFPYPLFDELRYMAGDYAARTGESEAYYQKYMEALQTWCAVPGAPETLRLFCAYLSRGTLARDLQTQFPGLELKKEGKKKICFGVYQPGGAESRLWEQEEVLESWRRYSRALQEAAGGQLCYVTGAHLPAAEGYPKLIGNQKLISSKEDGTLKYLGHFEESAEALSVSSEASAKAHNMIRWLMGRKGVRSYIYGMRLLVWADNGDTPPQPLEDDGDGFEEGEEEIPAPDTAEAYAALVGEAAAGYRNALINPAMNRPRDVYIMAMRGATPGRMSIQYYQECDGNTYIDNLAHWHTSCCWSFWRKGKLQISTPTPKEIATAVYGSATVRIAQQDKKDEKAATKLVRQLYARLMPCIAARKPLPEDILWAAFRNASRPLSFTDDKGEWQTYEWQTAVAVTCALLNNIKSGRENTMALDEARGEREYLYGRLLGIADYIEEQAMRGNGDGAGRRKTNAIRYMQRFQQRPAETWLRLQTQLLLPYMNKLPPEKSEYLALRIRQIGDMLGDGLADNAPLGPLFLQGYYSQKQAFYTKKTDNAGGTKE